MPVATGSDDNREDPRKKLAAAGAGNRQGSGCVVALLWLILVGAGISGCSSGTSATMQKITVYVPSGSSTDVVEVIVNNSKLGKGFQGDSKPFSFVPSSDGNNSIGSRPPRAKAPPSVISLPRAGRSSTSSATSASSSPPTSGTSTCGRPKQASLSASIEGVTLDPDIIRRALKETHQRPGTKYTLSRKHYRREILLSESARLELGRGPKPGSASLRRQLGSGRLWHRKTLC